MKSIEDVLRSKEEEILRVRKEIEALRIAARILDEDGSTADHKAEHRQLLQMP
jgi:hypothetical protein